jgi:hypothetical protein
MSVGDGRRDATRSNPTKSWHILQAIERSSMTIILSQSVRNLMPSRKTSIQGVIRRAKLGDQDEGAATAAEDSRVLLEIIAHDWKP